MRMSGRCPALQAASHLQRWRKLMKGGMAYAGKALTRVLGFCSWAAKVERATVACIVATGSGEAEEPEGKGQRGDQVGPSEGDIGDCATPGNRPGTLIPRPGVLGGVGAGGPRRRWGTGDRLGEGG